MVEIVSDQTLRMEKLKAPIYFSTLFLVIYVIMTRIESTASISMVMFGLSPLVVLWLAYKILKDGTPSGNTFNRKFYDDHDYERVQVKELEIIPSKGSMKTESKLTATRNQE